MKGKTSSDTVATASAAVAVHSAKAVGLFFQVVSSPEYTAVVDSTSPVAVYLDSWVEYMAELV